MSLFSPVYFSHPGFTRVHHLPSYEQINGFLSSALARFIVLSTRTRHFYVQDNLYLHYSSELRDAFPEIYFDSSSLLGFLADYPIFSLAFAENEMQSRHFLPLASLHFSLIDRISQPILAAHVFACFHEHTKYCSKCGSRLEFLDITRTHLRCETCHREVYPMISPCVIFAVFARDRLLVGLRHGNVFTNFSGFVEVAECAEQAVVREFEEETGIPRQWIKKVTNLQVDQPWGNQYGYESLMLCYFVEGEDAVDVTGNEEVKYLKWVDFKQWKDAARRTDGAYYQNEPESWTLPEIGTIARWMMEKGWDQLGLWDY